MAVTETKELKAQWKADVDLPEYTLEDVGAHKSRNDLWIIIHGKGTCLPQKWSLLSLNKSYPVCNVTEYLKDHPGGADVLIEVAGTDATAAYEDVGHSEDAREIIQKYVIGGLKDAHEFVRPSAVRVVQQTQDTKVTTQTSWKTIAAAASLLGALSVVSVFFTRRLRDSHLPPGGFTNGFLAATALWMTTGSVLGRKLAQFTNIESGFTKYSPHVKAQRVIKPDAHLTRGFIDPKEYKSLPLIKKDRLSPDVFRFIFALPDTKGVLGLPIGQHVAIKAVLDGVTVTRSYTPVSNNADLGRLELVIKCYPDGLLTGKYLVNLKVGEEVKFRGPKGAMRYGKDLCKRIGMVAGGTGITPMYQLIRAICESDTDTTEVSLIYANRSEADILLRKELEAFARKYPNNFKLWYMLDRPPQNWAYGTGFVTQKIMAERLPTPSADTRIMLCGPPGMVNASKKALVGLGFEAPGAVAKMSDQVFCF
jgi:cytochrome-b5 reductase